VSNRLTPGGMAEWAPSSGMVIFKSGPGRFQRPFLWHWQMAPATFIKHGITRGGQVHQIEPTRTRTRPHSRVIEKVFNIKAGVQTYLGYKTLSCNWHVIFTAIRAH